MQRRGLGLGFFSGCAGGTSGAWAPEQRAAGNAAGRFPGIAHALAQRFRSGPLGRRRWTTLPRSGW
eukprot:4309968-Alexandrium_andersonii.AAC.1